MEESVTQGGEQPQDDDNKPILTQINEWMGRRHRVWFFLSGILVALVPSTYLHTYLVSVTESAYRAHTDQLSQANILLQDENRRLRDTEYELTSQLKVLQDSINELTSLGVLFGRYKVKMPPVGRQYSPTDIDIAMIGNKLYATAFPDTANPALDLTVDTCTTPSKTGVCEVKDWLPLSMNNPMSYELSGRLYYFVLREISSSSYTVDIYRAPQ